MAEIGTVLIPALAALGGAGITAVGAYLTSRERYSQRMERLASIREKVADNPRLLDRVDQMIHFEISATSFGKDQSMKFALSTFLVFLGYSIYVAKAIVSPDTIMAFLTSSSSDWLVLVSIPVGCLLFAISLNLRDRAMKKSLPEVVGRDEVARSTRPETAD